MQGNEPTLHCNNFFRLLLPAAGVLFSTLAIAQDKKCPPPDNSKAVKLYGQGMDKRKYDKGDRVNFLKKALEMEPEYADVLFQLAEEVIKTARVEGKPYKPAMGYLEKLEEVCPDYNAYVHFYLGQIAYSDGRFTKAQEHFRKFIRDEETNKKDVDFSLAEELLILAKEYAIIFENPVPFDPKCIEGVNTKADEYLAVISPDDEYIFFTRRVTESEKFSSWSTEGKQVEYFSRASRKNNGFDAGDKLPEPFNLGGNYGGATITPDNKHLYLTICKPVGAYINCDIYSSDFVNGKWDSLKPLHDQINTKDGWEAQPSVSSDGKTLYFSGFRKGSQGMDIYKTEKQPDGKWGPAVRLGDTINTPGHEKSPFLHSDSQTLYFSSNTHTGIGGFDIFMSKSDANGRWQKPVNLRHPINTPGDEVGFFVSTDGKYGYFATNSLKDKSCAGGYDLYYFDLYKEARPEKVMFIKGDVKTGDDGSLANTRVEVTNLETKKVTRLEVDSTDGKYVAIVATSNNEDLLLTVKEPGKAISFRLISTKDSESGKKVEITTELKTIKAGSTYRINDINFATNSSKINQNSLRILDELVNFMNENPRMKIAIQGHTDDIGNDRDNLALSTDRAFSVMEYLQSKGISKDRLSFKGFGESMPLVPNTSDENRRINRRTEFKVIAF